ncbi:MAG: glycosyltransferase family 4 protein, partial [Bacteroidota bacterium]
AYSCNPYKGSEAGNGWNLSFQLAQQGHQVWCFTSSRNREDIDKYLADNEVTNLEMVFIPMPKWADRFYEKSQMGVYYHYIVWQSRAGKKARKLHKEVNFDMVHHITLASPQMGSGMWRLNIPFVYGPLGGGQFAPEAFKKYFHGYWKQETRRAMVSNLLMKYNPNTRKALKAADVVLVTNPETHNFLKSEVKHKLEYFLDTSLPEDFFAESMPQRPARKEIKLLWVGRIYARKGLPLVLEGLSKVDPSIAYKLTIVGDGPMGAMVPGWIKEFDLEDKVDWIGRIPWNEVKKAYLEHDVFIFCSLRESFGSQLLESMAYGLPIITLNHQGAGYFVPDEASIKVSVESPEQSAQEIAAAVALLSKDPDKRYQMGQVGFDFAREQVWSKKTRHLGEKYDRLLNPA